VLSNQQHKAFSHLPYPLCKMQDTSIIHNFIGPVFQCHYVSKLPAKSFDLSEATRTTIANAAAGMVSSLISGVYFVPLDVVMIYKGLTLFHFILFIYTFYPDNSSI